MDSIKQLLFKFWFVVNPIAMPNVVFILSHMRSGSSILEHILSSNSQILGTGEQSRIYHKKTDFNRMELFARWNQKSIFKSYKYTVDQLLHNDFTPNKTLLKNNHIKFIFLIRSPCETISSIENLGGYPYSIDNTGKYSSLNYYIDRLNELVIISKGIPSNSQCFLTYKDLTVNTDKTLHKISQFLELRTPLKKEYKLKSSTGKLGDRSEYIKRGKVIITKKNLIELDSEAKEKLDKIYRKTSKYFNFIKLKNQNHFTI